MNRKDFFKRIGLTSVALAVAPKLLFSEDVKKSDYLKDFNQTIRTSGNINKYEWFAENRNWLMKWFDNYEVIDIPLKEISATMQIFKTYMPQSQVYRLDEYYEQHKIEMLMSAVFSKPISFTSPMEKLSTMNGFLNQTGRLPTKKDKVIFEVCPSDSKGKRFLRITETRENGYSDYLLLSDCRIKIIT